MKISSSQLKKNGLSKTATGIIILAWIIILLNNKFYTGEAIHSDVTYYYSYLPAVFIYKDIEFSYIEHNPFLGNKLWPDKAPNGKSVSKTTMGLALLWTPFFLMGHVAAGVLNYPMNGYVPPYYIFLYLGVLFYLSLGILALKKALLHFFRDATVALTLLSVFFGTNLMYYATVEPLMPHVFIFSIISMILYMTIKWHEVPKLRNSLLLGILFGFLILIRPTHILILLIPLFYDVYNKETLAKKLILLKNKFGQLIIIGLTIFVVYLPQLIYWKKITGDWLFYSYGNERFYFSNPHIVEGLFSYRKGWFLYTPIMVFAIAGFFFLKNKARQLFYSTTFVFLISFYIILSWWCWWYGGSYGLRAFIDYYGLLAFPMAALYQRCLDAKKILRISFVSLASVLILFSCFQTYQKKRGLIHFDGMTKEVYWLVWGKVDIPEGYWKKLKQPDYEKARDGLPSD